MKNTAIEWADNTLNFWRGCTMVSEGCIHCYAKRLMQMFPRLGSFDEINRVDFSRKQKELAKWDQSRIFVNSMSDTFHEDVPFAEIDAMMEILMQFPHTYIFLTKRPERMLAYLDSTRFDFEKLDNFWFGVSVENQKYCSRAYSLLDYPVAVRFVSFEPLLGPIKLKPEIKFIDWAIIGGESGPDYRETKKEWIEDLIQQLKQHEIPVFLKQLGGRSKCRCHGAYGCRMLNGMTYDEFPEIKL